MTFNTAVQQTSRVATVLQDNYICATTAGGMQSPALCQAGVWPKSKWTLEVVGHNMTGMACEIK